MSDPEKCRNCGQELPIDAGQDSPWYPFCSERCRWIDLGQWFNQNYRVGEDADGATPGKDSSGAK